MANRAEIEFIRMWTSCAVDGTVSVRSVGNYYPEHRAPVPWPRGVTVALGADGWSLTQRGADLIATAKHVGLDNLVADYETPEPMADDTPTTTCPGCNGRGRVDSLSTGRERTIVDLVHGEQAREPVALPGWDYTCPTCKGCGEVPEVAEWEDVLSSGVGRETPLRKADGQVYGGTSAPPYRAVDSEWFTLTAENGPGLVGKRIEYQYACRTRSATLAGADEFGVLSTEWGWIPYCAAYRVRVVADESPWVTDRDEMIALLRASVGRRVDFKWSTGENFTLRVKSVSQHYAVCFVGRTTRVFNISNFGGLITAVRLEDCAKTARSTGAQGEGAPRTAVTNGLIGQRVSVTGAGWAIPDGVLSRDSQGRTVLTSDDGHVYRVPDDATVEGDRVDAAHPRDRSRAAYANIVRILLDPSGIACGRRG